MNFVHSRRRSSNSFHKYMEMELTLFLKELKNFICKIIIRL